MGMDGEGVEEVLENEERRQREEKREFSDRDDVTS